jgi:phosphatidylethanolamine/phosphatidyl-N-methylethanolamine N-methyltransferase
LDIESIQKSYRRYAPHYDFCFGALFQAGRRAVIERMNCKPGDRVLEVGIGTGLSLPLYPAGVHVTGIDLVPEMLERAQRRCCHQGLAEYIELLPMDAEHMAFRDNCFDKVAAMYVVSVAPQPSRLVSEMRRVCKPNGELFILGHFNSPNPVIGGVERLLAPLSRKLGWRSDLSLETLLRDTDLTVLERVAVNLFGYWLLLRVGNSLQLTSAAVTEAAQAERRPAIQL